MGDTVAAHNEWVAQHWERVNCQEVVVDAARAVVAAAKLRVIPGSEPPMVERVSDMWARVGLAVSVLAESVDVLDALDRGEDGAQD